MTRHRRHHREWSSDRDESDSSYSWSPNYGRRHKKRHSRSDTTCHIKRHSRHYDCVESSYEAPEMRSIRPHLDPYIIRGGRRVRCRCGKRDGLQEDVPQAQCKEGCLLCEKHERKSSRRSRSCSTRLPDLCFLCPAHTAKKINHVPEYLMIQPPPELPSCCHSACPIAVPTNRICARTHLPSPPCVSGNRMMCLADAKYMCHCSQRHESKSKNEAIPEEGERWCVNEIKAIKAPDVPNQRKHSPVEHAGKSECETTVSQSLTTASQCPTINKYQKEQILFEQSGGKYECSRPDVCGWKQQTGQQCTDNFAREECVKAALPPPAQQLNQYAKPLDDCANGHNESKKAQLDPKSFDLHQNSSYSRQPAGHPRRTTASMMMSQPMSDWFVRGGQFMADDSCDSEVSSRYVYSCQQQYSGSPQQWWQYPTNTRAFNWNCNSSSTGNAQGYTLPHPPYHVAAEHETGNEKQPEGNCFWEREKIQNSTQTGNEGERSSVHPSPGPPYVPWHHVLQQNSNEHEIQQQEESAPSNVNKPLINVFEKAVPLKNGNQISQADRGRSMARPNRVNPKWKYSFSGMQQATRGNKASTTTQRQVVSRRTVFTQTIEPETLANTTVENKKSSCLDRPIFITRGTSMRRYEKIITPRRTRATQTLADYPPQRRTKSLDRATIASKSKTCMIRIMRKSPKPCRELSKQTYLSKKGKPWQSRSIENASDASTYSRSQELERRDSSSIGFQRKSSCSMHRSQSDSKSSGSRLDREHRPSRPDTRIKCEKGVQAGPSETKEIAVQAECPSVHNLCHSRSSKSMEENASQNSVILPRALNCQLKSTNSASDVCVSIPSEHTFSTTVLPTVPGYGVSMPCVPWPYPMYAPLTTADTKSQKYVIKCKECTIAAGGTDCEAISLDSKRYEAEISERPERDEMSGRTITLKSVKTKDLPLAHLVRRPGYSRQNSLVRSQQQNSSLFEQDRSRKKTKENAALSNQHSKDCSGVSENSYTHSGKWAIQNHPRRLSVGPERESEYTEPTTTPTNQLSNTAFSVNESRSSNSRDESNLNKFIVKPQQPTKLSAENIEAENTRKAADMKVQQSKFSPTRIQHRTSEGVWKTPVTQVECVQKEVNANKLGMLKSAIGERRFRSRKEV